VPSGGVIALLLSTGVSLGLLLAPAAADDAAAETDSRPDGEDSYYFYSRLDYGSERLISPLRTITNGGFGILDMQSRSNQLSDIEWRNGWHNLWLNLGSPLRAINERGWGKFLKTEVIPFSVEPGGAQYWPNYMNHLIGGGFSYRLMREWYRSHGFAYETIWAVFTMAADHLLNETVEMDGTQGWNVDPVADIYIFDLGSMILFSSDRIARFFGRTLHMADWSLLSYYDPAHGTLENISQKYMVRLRLGHTTPWYLFYHWGNSGELGLSRHVGGGRHLSAGFGFVAKNLVKVDRFSQTADLATTFGVFYDRHGSLLASLQYSRTRDSRWRANFYPGLLRLGPFQPGLAVSLHQGGAVSLGVTFGSIPILPTGLGTRLHEDS
jgi:hypothetical protein